MIVPWPTLALCVLWEVRIYFWYFGLLFSIFLFVSLCPFIYSMSTRFLKLSSLWLVPFFFPLLPSTDTILLSLKQREKRKGDLGAYSVTLIQKSVVLVLWYHIGNRYSWSSGMYMSVSQNAIQWAPISPSPPKEQEALWLTDCRLPCRAQILLVIHLIHIVQVVLIPPKNNLSYFFSLP